MLELEESPQSVHQPGCLWSTVWAVFQSTLECWSKGRNIPRLQSGTASLCPDGPCGSCIPIRTQTATLPPGLLLGHPRPAEDDQLNKAILEMLHINKVSASHDAKPHPYMRKIYQRLDSLEAQDSDGSDGTLVQSYRSVDGPHHAPPGWIWFNVSSLKPFMLGAELVLFRKSLHPLPISVTVSLESITASEGTLTRSRTLHQRPLTLDQRPSSGYDVFDVSGVLPLQPVGGVGFQLRYADDSGSLVLHEALTQSLYSVSRGSLSEPLLVLYQSPPRHV
ncbi:uncharacterized protein [Antennarius striatus]|uniref:uncharacterized protein n=1 Tax=Antennarius striatus TaxID=241820 RepID=UPI0035B42AEA